MELELVLGEAKAREVAIDQDRDGVAEISRRLAGRQQHVVAIESGERDPVARQIVGRHNTIGLQTIGQTREVEA